MVQGRELNGSGWNFPQSFYRFHPRYGWYILIYDPLQRAHENQSDRTRFPHRVEMIVPKDGFGKRLDAMRDWHRARSIRPRLGRGRRDGNNRDYVTWCFADAAMADSFRASFK